MYRAKPPARKRIGRVSLYLHRRQWYAYYRQAGRAVRQPLCSSESEAEVRASLINARLVAEAAGVSIHDLDQDLVVARAAAVCTAAPSITVAELRSKFLHHHEHVLGSSIGTVSRYATATRHLLAFCEREGVTDALAVPVALFVERLRTVEVSPNGHANSSKRRLLDKGVRYILETCRSMYHFGLRRNHLPRQQPNPFSEIGLGQLRIRDAKRIFVFSPEQELAFFQAAQPWAFAVHFTLAKTGLRSGELVHLLIEDLDLVNGWLHVRSKPELGWVTKTNRERRVPLVEPVARLLAAVVEGRPHGVVFRRQPKNELRPRASQCTSHANGLSRLDATRNSLSATHP